MSSAAVLGERPVGFHPTARGVLAGASLFYQQHRRALNIHYSEGTTDTVSALPSVTSDGSTVESLLQSLRKNLGTLDPYAEDLISSPGFTGPARFRVLDPERQDTVRKPSVLSRGERTSFAVIRGRDIPSGYRTRPVIDRLAARKGYLVPSAESGALLRLALSDEDMLSLGIRTFVVMHTAIAGACGMYDHLVLQATCDFERRNIRLAVPRLHVVHKSNRAEFPEEYDFLYRLPPT